MWNKRKVSLMSLILLVSIIITPIQSYGATQELDIDYFQNILNILEDNYVEEKSTQDYIEKSIEGLFDTLDNYSEYYTKEKFTKLNEDLQGNFVGIGAYIAEENGYIKIVRPIQGSPAEKAGILPNDVVIRINGKIAKGLSAEEATKLIKGEKDTVVKLKIRRNGELKTISITRDQVLVDPVQYQVIDDIGYIILEQFNDNSYEKILDALTLMDKKNISKIILDLRDNPGGYLDQAIYIANLFVPEGPIVHIKYGEETVETYDSSLEALRYSLVLLVNENSASASEILAAAVKDTKAGTLVGATTFGKGTVQQVMLLPRGDGIKLTVAEYYSPNMNKIDGLGVTPDIIVEIQDKEDTQLKKALDLLSF